MESARWKQEERFVPGNEQGALILPITADRSLSMMIVCEARQEGQVIGQIERWVNAPWELDPGN
jgi:hypothetical protein